MEIEMKDENNDWFYFFIECGISNENSKKYSILFEEKGLKLKFNKTPF